MMIKDNEQQNKLLYNERDRLLPILIHLTFMQPDYIYDKKNRKYITKPTCSSFNGSLLAKLKNSIPLMLLP